MAASGLVVAAAAFATHLWRVLPWPRIGFELELGVLALAIAWPARRLLRWSMASALALAWCGALVWFAGPAAVGAAGLLAIAALAIGTCLVPATPGRIAIALPTGLLAIAGIAGWMLQWPVHHRATWGVVLAGTAVVRQAALRSCLQDIRAGWARAIAGAPAWSAFAIMSLGLTSTACWLPTLQADDLTYHLGLPSQLLAQHRYVPDPLHQVWSYAAWAGDALQGIAGVLAGGSARGAVNALWLCSGAAAAWAVVSRWSASPRERWVGVALYAGFPPLAWLAAGMQTELAATAALLALAAAVWPVAIEDATDDAPRWRWRAAAVLSGGLLALKPMHALAALPLVAWAMWHARGRIPLARLFGALAIVLLVGGSSYAFGWSRTGNPVLPLFNALFRSPYFPASNFDDLRWHAGLAVTLPWDLVVATHRYGEGWDGGLGIGLLALAGAGVLAIARSRTRSIALAAALAMLLPLLPLQYARYAVPGMVLWLLVAVPGMERALGRRAFGWAMAIVCAVNLALLGNAGWTQHSGVLKRLVRAGGDAAVVLADDAPERVLLSSLPDDGAIVLATDPDRGFVAELAGRGRTVSWHDPALAMAREAAERDPSGARWRALIASTRARWVLLVPATASPALRRGVAADGAVRTRGLGDVELWRMSTPR